MSDPVCRTDQPDRLWQARLWQARIWQDRRAFIEI